MQFNINNHVRVRLTPFGRRILESNHEEFWRAIGIDKPYRPPTEDAAGWSDWPFWSLMAAFGRNVHAGGDVPFETTIEIRDVDLIDGSTVMKYEPPPAPKRDIRL